MGRHCASASNATVAMPPSLANVMSKLVETVLIPFGKNRRTNCVDGALLHARPEPTNIDDIIISQRFSLK